jgi:hypothetical protein
MVRELKARKVAAWRSGIILLIVWVSEEGVDL